MTSLRMHRQLEGAWKRAERAVSLARTGRQAIESSIDDLHQQIEAVRSGCVDLDLGSVLVKAELRMLYLLRELERFEREVSQPAEELHRRATASFAPASVRFSDSSEMIRTPV